MAFRSIQLLLFLVLFAGACDDGTSACGPSGLTCDLASEVCVGNVSFTVEHRCRPLPADCENDRVCGCVGATLCEQPFYLCTDSPEENTVTCVCPACG